MKRCTTSSYSRAWGFTLVLSTLGLAVGCTLIEPQVTPVNRDVYRALPPPQQEVAPRYEGSLFSGENGRNMFFVDRKARAVNEYQHQPYLLSHWQPGRPVWLRTHVEEQRYYARVCPGSATQSRF